MTINFFNNQYRKIWVTLLLAALGFICLHVHVFDPKQENLYDSGENLVGAFTLAQYNTYSINSEPHPASKREPFLPFLLSGVIKIKNLFIIHANRLQEQPIESINRLKILPITMLFATISICFIFVYVTTANYWLALYTLVTLIFSSALIQSAHSFLSEITSAFFCVIISILLYYSKKWQSQSIYYIGLSLAVSALVLTKAVYLYAVPLILVFLMASQYFKLDLLQKTNLKNIAIFLSCFILIVGGWMLRNYYHFGRMFIADRKAEVLMVRAEFNRLSSDAYPYLYVIWAPGFSKYFLTEDKKSAWSRVVDEQVVIDTYNHPLANFYKDKTMNPNGSYSQAVYLDLENIAWGKILQNPLGHLKLTLAFLYRSYFIEDGAGLAYLGFKLPRESNFDKRVDNIFLAVLVNLPGWLALLYITWCAFREQDLALFGLILLPIYTVLIYSCFAFSHHRYMLPLVPLLTLLTCLSIKKIFMGDHAVKKIDRGYTQKMKK